MTVSWSASTDDVAVTAYDVYRGGALAATVDAPGLSFVDGGRDPSTTYSYRPRPGRAGEHLARQHSARLGDHARCDSDDHHARAGRRLLRGFLAPDDELRHLDADAVDASPIVRAYLMFTIAGLKRHRQRSSYGYTPTTRPRTRPGSAPSVWRTPLDGDRDHVCNRPSAGCGSVGINGRPAGGGRLSHHRRNTAHRGERHLLDRPDDDQLDCAFPRQPPVDEPATARHHDLASRCGDDRASVVHAADVHTAGSSASLASPSARE